jgi:hypothetical protein
VRLLEVVPPSRGVRVAGEVRSNTLVDSPGPRPDEDDGTEQSLCEHADDQPQHADDSTTVVSDCLVRWCHITSDRLSVLQQHHCDARSGSVMHLEDAQRPVAPSNQSPPPFMTHSEAALVSFIVAHQISQDGDSHGAVCSVRIRLPDSEWI